MSDSPVPTEKVVVYTDGACSGNPGPGGWGALLEFKGVVKELKGGERKTTNNRMELMAAIKALDALNGDQAVVLHTDSKYVMDGINSWLPSWKQRGWKTSKKKPVKNQDLWQALDDAVQRHDIKWVWVKGHDGNPGNEEADELANLGIDEL